MAIRQALFDDGPSLASDLTRDDNHAERLELRKQLDFLQERDSSVRVRGALATFLDLVATQALRTDHAGPIELQAMSVLGGGDESAPSTEAVVQRSLAAFLRSKRDPRDLSSPVAQRLAHIRVDFVSRHGLPSWVPVASQRAGLDFWQTAALCVALEKIVGPIGVDSKPLGQDTLAWARSFIEVVANIAPGRLLTVCEVEDLARVSETLGEMLKEDPTLALVSNLRWNPEPRWSAAWRSEVFPVLEKWMAGETIAEIASQLVGRPVDDIESARSAGQQPIPKALAVATGLFDKLAALAGGLVAIVELLLGSGGAVTRVPAELACLPLAIKNGFNSPEALAWFRFGLRLRRPAHLLARLFPIRFSPYDDKAMRQEIDRVKQNWLRSEQRVPGGFEADAPVLSAIRSFVLA